MSGFDFDTKGPPEEVAARFAHFIQEDVDHYPLEALPDNVKSIVEGFEKAHHSGHGLIATQLLGVLGGAIRKGLLVEGVYPGGTPALLYVLTVGEPGAGKSAVMKELLTPLKALDAEKRRKFKQSVKAKKLKERKQDNSALMGLEIPVGAEKCVPQDNAELDAWLEKNKPILAASDFTAIGLGRALSNSGECLLLYNSEGAQFADVLRGKRDGGNVQDSLISGCYSGDPYEDVRETRDPIALSNPRMAMVWACTPQDLAGVYDNQQLYGRGLLSRILVTAETQPPALKLGKEVYEPRDEAKAWKSLLTTCLQKYGSRESPKLVPVDEEAVRVLHAFTDGVNRMRSEGEHFGMENLTTRLGENAIRLAGALYAAQEAEGPLTLEIAKSALLIARHHYHQLLCLRANPEGKAKQEEGYLKKAEEVLKEHGEDMTFRELSRKARPEKCNIGTEHAKSLLQKSPNFEVHSSGKNSLKVSLA